MGSFAFLGQALVQTTLPHSDPGVSSFERTSGPVSLSIVADPRGAASKTCCSLIKHSFSGIPSGRMIGFRGQAASSYRRLFFAMLPSRRCRSTCACCTPSPGRPWLWHLFLAALPHLCPACHPASERPHPLAVIEASVRFRLRRLASRLAGLQKTIPSEARGCLAVLPRGQRFRAGDRTPRGGQSVTYWPYGRGATVLPVVLVGQRSSRRPAFFRRTTPYPTSFSWSRTLQFRRALRRYRAPWPRRSSAPPFWQPGFRRLPSPSPGQAVEIVVSLLAGGFLFSDPGVRCTASVRVDFCGKLFRDLHSLHP